jgi:hypothetical protein
MMFSCSLPLVEKQGAAPAYCVHCDHCARSAPVATSQTEAVFSALRDGWKIRLLSFSAESEFIGAADLIEACDLNDVFCPACLKSEFE